MQRQRQGYGQQVYAGALAGGALAGGARVRRRPAQMDPHDGHVVRPAAYCSEYRIERTKNGKARAMCNGWTEGYPTNYSPYRSPSAWQQFVSTHTKGVKGKPDLASLAQLYRQQMAAQGIEVPPPRPKKDPKVWYYTGGPRENPQSYQYISRGILGAEI